jgi:phenylacetyl-CoA:acceptor oxidoreductase 26-kDa subunit
MSYGPNPWHQTSWDARAAGNFVCGGAGAGLVVATALSGVRGAALTAMLLAGLALVGLGLFCVFLELGRQLRSANVILNPRTSWMSREALAAGLLFAAGLAAVFGLLPNAWPAAVVALVFVYCQARILQAAKGIPAWREPLLVPLVVATGLTEGAGLFLVAAPLSGEAAAWVVVGFELLLVVRYFVWHAYRRRVAGSLSGGAARALDQAGQVLRIAGTVVPIVLAVAAVVATGRVAGPLPALLAAAAGLVAASAGGWMKFALVTRAGFNQGFVLPRLPVRGQPHVPARGQPR